MAVLAAAIETHGFVPGLWLAPFLVTKSSAVYREHPDWLLKRSGGKPFVCGFNDKWDGAFFCLDLSRTDVLEYLDSVMKRVVEEWGFRYLKLDFMYAGLLEGAFDYGGSAFRHYERALDILVRRTATPSGQPVAYLGCGVPFQASYRHFPLSRIGADTKEDWDWPLLRALNHAGRPAALVNLRDTLGRSFLDGAVFINDPDGVFLREENCRLNEGEKELVALGNYLFASQIMFSDNPARFGPEAGFTARISELYENLDALEDEFAPVAIAPDVWRVTSRNGSLDGIVNLRDRAVDVEGFLDEEGRKSLSRRDMLVDRRENPGTGLSFGPRSISLVANSK
jgi:alpha-galactosidase